MQIYPNIGKAIPIFFFLFSILLDHQNLPTYSINKSCQKTITLAGRQPSLNKSHAFEKH